MYDNARPHVAQVVKIYLKTLKWDVIFHLSYSLDIVPLYYNIFISITHGLVELHFRSYEEVKNFVDSLVDLKYEQFFRYEIRMLPEILENDVVSDGQYFLE